MATAHHSQTAFLKNLTHRTCLSAYSWLVLLEQDSVSAYAFVNSEWPVTECITFSDRSVDCGLDGHSVADRETNGAWTRSGQRCPKQLEPIHGSHPISAGHSSSMAPNVWLPHPHLLRLCLLGFLALFYVLHQDQIPTEKGVHWTGHWGQSRKWWLIECILGDLLYLLFCMLLPVHQDSTHLPETILMTFFCRCMFNH